MDGSRIFALIMGVAGVIFLAWMIPAILRSKRELDLLQVDFDAYMAEYEERRKGK